ncbi:hypothetical protein [Xanthomonas euvesicatoria]|uniref:hypothetical protein n=1 Tax=Xanthomonas euvesicatoria TaxID=456327 RepID=UPI0010AD15B0|nr:hypothetical protein [Xanthomonas euvesicatoria]TKA16818.1 hypothetical protein TP41_14310 [Xanthomonas euvesicatoria pv. citrumelonis]
MNDDASQENLKRWFNSTGFPLEIRSARAFVRARFAVEHSAVYIDPETSKGREIDLLAYRRDATGCFATFFVVECKSSDKPWVVLTNRNQYNRFGGLWIATMSQKAREAMGTHVSEYLLAYEDYLGSSVGGYALKQAFSGQSDHAYTASIGALKAAASLVKREDSALAFGFPTIVVSTPIYEYSEGPNGEQRFLEVPTSSFEFSAHWEHYNRAVIRIVSEAHLPEYAEQCSLLAERYQQIFAQEIGESFRSGM